MEGDNQHLFDLPIYIEAEAIYFDRFMRHVEDRVNGAWRRNPRRELAWHRERSEISRERDLDAYGGLWRYNQIFGFLGIYPLGDQLRGATWYTTRRVVRRNIARKGIDFYGKAFELTVSSDMTSPEIFESLMSAVRRLRRERPYRRRYLDTSPLEIVGAFLDWRGIMDVSTDSAICGTFEVRVENLPHLLAQQAARVGACRVNEPSREAPAE